MKNLIKRFLNSYLYCVGLSAILIVFCSYFTKLTPKIGMAILEVMVLSSIPVALSTALLFKNRLSLHILWIRRAILMIIGGTVYPLSFIAFGLVKRENVLHYIIFILINVCAVSICSCIAYIIGDKIERKNIRKINEHIKNNNFQR